LQRLVQPQGNDVMDATLLQVADKCIVTKSAVGSQQPNALGSQVLLGVGQEGQRVVGCMARSRAQPAVGHHAAVGHKGHQRMVAQAARFAGVVAFAGTLRRAVAGDDAGVQIEGDVAVGCLLKQPAVEHTKAVLVAHLVEFAKHACDGFEVGHALQAKYLRQCAIKAGDFAVFKTVGSAPDGEHELHHELLAGVGAVGARLGQAAVAQRSLKVEVLKHLVHQRHAAPGGDFFVGKPQFKCHASPRSSPL
jgi:hypothetical protein